MSLPDGLISYGPDANCTLELCPISSTVFQYRPSLPANAIFLTLFAICMIIHAIQGVRWRTWFYSIVMVLGCISEVIGYGGRILLYQDPFSFNGFLLEIILIGFAPAWFTAAIYVTLSRTVIYLGPQYSRFSPKFYYWVFIPCDILSLCLQAVGGALSSTSSGTSNVAVDVSIAGLSFQVFTLVIFNALALEFALRYRKARRTGAASVDIPPRFMMFAGLLSLAMLLILIRCIYRIAELKDGYMGPLLHNESLFIGLEGVTIVIAAFLLNAAHIGWVFGSQRNVNGDPEKVATDETGGVQTTTA